MNNCCKWIGVLILVGAFTWAINFVEHLYSIPLWALLLAVIALFDTAVVMAGVVAGFDEI